ncbi:hypothetical protein Lpp221_03322 [Lacticaseibacillus paracasei subsp. paracasei Lpp221]|uniref:Uncharacterized protein n=5 Tax=Lacticaseibacillus paracasei TaxID=1597 RepID=A0A829H3F7_LACPA|nr:hypothetical protein LPEG9_04575 [Lacticaseibacillus paracasei]AZP98328.1 hypothetical protein CYL78_05610 [Lacticaseibacillus paracasei subsp. tolerans]EEI66814.1 hypothetical protein HMPREF0530_2903 [Lacticaseibacillus paracasei subsp. paracasei ATCC 25302 = DSM 5622 = JCM 8130]EPC46945.1 hypothetical protein Lpp219_01439 [Lacticaseibacillus paracasei subsp. paracasei Lpp219]EPC52694.1 hypothetical protein Lpp123_08957 [Lacticaseibacillus paracasei subsp. paracasei Lpp123]EPC55196.1 hypot
MLSSLQRKWFKFSTFNLHEQALWTGQFVKISKKKTHCFGAHSAKRYVSEVIYRKLLSITQKLALIKVKNK